MARINLLPWREELRKERQKQFAFMAAGSAVIALLVVLYIHMHVNGMIENQNSRNDFLKQQISEVESKIREIESLEKQKGQLLARMRVIERLQSNRPEIVHMFDSLAKAVPEGLYLTGIKQNGRTLVIEGRAQSNARVSSFMRNLDASPWFENPVLDVIEAKGNNTKNKGDDRSRDFVLRVTQATAKQG